MTSGLKVFLNDRIVVRFAEGVQVHDQQAAAQYGLNVVETLSGPENIYVFEFQRPKETNPFQVCLALAQNAEVCAGEFDLMDGIGKCNRSAESVSYFGESCIGSAAGGNRSPSFFVCGRVNTVAAGEQAVTAWKSGPGV